MIPPGRTQRSLRAIVRKSYWRAEDARVLLAAWRGSGLTLAAFARRHGFSRSRLAQWQTREPEDAVPRFHPVRLVEHGERASTAASPALEVIPGSRRVVVPPGFDAAQLRAVLRALEEPGC